MQVDGYICSKQVIGFIGNMADARTKALVRRSGYVKFWSIWNGKSGTCRYIELQNILLFVDVDVFR